MSQALQVNCCTRQTNQQHVSPDCTRIPQSGQLSDYQFFGCVTRVLQVHQGFCLSIALWHTCGCVPNALIWGRLSPCSEAV